MSVARCMRFAMGGNKDKSVTTTTTSTLPFSLGQPKRYLLDKPAKSLLPLLKLLVVLLGLAGGCDGGSLDLLLVVGAGSVGLLGRLSDDRLGSAANEAEDSTDHAEESEDEAGEDNTDFRLCLKGSSGVGLGGVDEVEEAGANPLDGVFTEGDVVVVGVILGGLLSSDLEGFLDLEGLGGELLGVLHGVADVDVVEEDVLGHSPEFDTDAANLGERLDGSLVLEVGGVGDLAGSPFALVGRVVDERGGPLATPFGIDLERTFPFTATRGVTALGVRNGRRDPFTIFLVVPFLRLGSVYLSISINSP